MNECIDCGIEILDNNNNIHCYDCALKEYEDYIKSIDNSDFIKQEVIK